MMLMMMMIMMMSAMVKMALSNNTIAMLAHQAKHPGPNGRVVVPQSSAPES